MSLEELAFPLVQQHDSSTRNGHATAREQLRGPLWPASDMWTDAAPKRFRDKSACKTPLKSWTRWLEYLGARKRPRAIEGLLNAKGSPLDWGAAEGVRQLLRAWDKALQQACKSEPARKKEKSTEKQGAQVSELQHLISDWQHAARIADGSTEVLWAYQAVAIARTLPELAALLAADEWWALVNELTIVAREAASLPLIEQSLASELLAAELPLTLAYQLPELVHCRALLPAARQALAHAILEFLDGEGVLHQRWWSIQRPLAASWTRCHALQAGLSDNVMDDETARQYTLAINELSRATREDGSQVLGTHGQEKVIAREMQELFAAAFAFVPDLREKSAAAKFQRSLQAEAQPSNAEQTASSNEEEKPRDYTAASINSEWAQVAIFRRSWEPREPLLACSYDRDQVALEISAGRKTIISGPWSGTLQVNGQPLAMQSPWREVCHISDADADYLELELQLEQGYKIQRQMCLGRKEKFVYLCDSVLGQETANLRYEQSLPLPPGIAAEQDAEMREVTLLGKKPRARVLPLALPEWRSEVRQGDLQAADSALTLTTVAQGRNLCSPWWIDLDAKRLGKPLTWRPLTIAENRVMCASEIARGWRVQIAERQWIIYRALAGKGNRTILGHNLISEFLLAQFKNGTTTNLVEIE